jgi:hypothetical protein
VLGILSCSDWLRRQRLQTGFARRNQAEPSKRQRR